MHKNCLLAILATKSFSKLCKSGSIKLSFLTKTANFHREISTIAAINHSFNLLHPLFNVRDYMLKCLNLPRMVSSKIYITFLGKILETFVPAKGCMQFIFVFQDFC